MQGTGAQEASLRGVPKRGHTCDNHGSSLNVWAEDQIDVQTTGRSFKARVGSGNIW